jgi:hypothetical protein
MRRKLPLLAALLLALGASVALAVAFTGSARADGTINWTGQGTTNGTLDTLECGASADFAGMTPPAGVTSTNYLVWVLSPVSSDPTSATLNTNGDTVTWPTSSATSAPGNTIKFLTKGYDLSALTAFVGYVGTLGGTPDLKISHGCLKASPTITTLAAKSGSAPNISVSDTATLHNFNAPVTGTVTFNLYGPGDPTCSGTPAFTSANRSVDSTTGVATSGSFTLLKPGTYSWTASFTGDTNNNLAAEFGCGLDSETYTFDQATSSVVTAVNGVDNTGHVALGSSVYDEATVTPSNATGSVTFTLYQGPFTGSPPDCTTGTVVGTPETVSPLVAGVADSTPLSNLAPGSYAYKANYKSDSPFFGDANGDCEPFTVDQGQLVAKSKLHDASHNVVADSSHVGLGSVMHDTAQISGQVPGFTPTGAVSFTFFKTIDCSDTGADAGPVTTDSSSGDPRSADTSALTPGVYGFEASVAGDTNYKGATSACEPFTVDKASTNASTAVVRDDTQAIVPQNGNVPVGTSVHDTATVGTQVGSFVIGGTVTYHFYASADCSTGEFGTLNSNTWPQNVTMSGGLVPNSQSTGSLSGGGYGFIAVYSGDGNYKGSTGSCESFTVRTFGKTMGFWGNKNGQALLVADNAFSTANAVTLGLTSPSGLCNVTVNAQSISQTILPNTLNGISVLNNCKTSSALDSGINANSLNTLLGQTLALSYNNLYKSGFAGQTIGGMGCTAVGTLTASSTTQATQVYANSLIANAVKGGTTVTQSQIGALNTLLGCMNSEA